MNLSYLGKTSISMKLKKNVKVNGVKTYCIYLLPSNASGNNVCPNSTKECRLGCLAFAGRVRMENENWHMITNARMKKTKLFFENQNYFMAWTIAEIRNAKFSAEKQGYGFSVRINGMSDIDYTSILYKGKNLFQIFPDVMFYDYTKMIDRYINMPINYHLTFSYSGRNTENCKRVLKNGCNVAVVFNVKKGKDLPESFLGYPVVDGDLTDYRIADPSPCIVGLRFKNIKDAAVNEQIKNSVFVVQV